MMTAMAATEIRYLTGNDASEYWKLRLEALEGDPEAYSASALEHRSLTLEEVRKRLGSEGGDQFVVGAVQGGRLIGTAGFYREKNLKIRHKGRIWGVYVTPTRRGTGVGKRMLQTILKRADEMNGLEQVLLSVAATQTAAFRLYCAMGFKLFGCEPRALRIGDRFIDEQYLVLRLKNDGPAEKAGF
jgi:ribosomal protein S18 acetylase RimI-like enzyme